MIFPISETWTMTVPVAQTTVTNLVNQWSVFLINEAPAIRELASLEAGARDVELDRLRSRIAADLPDVTPSDIVDDALLNNSSDPYRRYIERESTGWLHNAVNNVLAGQRGKYQGMLQGIIDGRQRQAHLGRYFFEQRDFNITIDIVDSHTLSVNFVANLEAKVVLDVDQAKVNIDADAVGLAGIATDIKREFLDVLRGALLQDIQNDYNGQVGAFGARTGAAFGDIGAVLH